MLHVHDPSPCLAGHPAARAVPRQQRVDPHAGGRTSGGCRRAASTAGQGDGHDLYRRGSLGRGQGRVIGGALERRPGLRRARRVITRATRAGDKAFRGVTPDAFAPRKARRDFGLDWQGQRLRYAIPRDPPGRADVIFNGSRAAQPAAQAVFPDLRVILAAALPRVPAARARGIRADIHGRRERAAFDLPPGTPAMVVTNDGSVGAGAARLPAARQPDRGAR